ncbi:hypothetical protein BN1184_BB_00220 [Pantoea ananatis]|nr:hypothetical protein C7426_10256 [Pantoea ananatis]PXW02159.1 hypothetical protein C7422_10356 [Pantoea ananatis]REC92035.1 hypothetical protein C7423_10256 [Pantoea ananatis]CRH29823.1 hypothetical protein BN1182_BL_00160 [Pantoea ananatis]CRH34308.1 hypothetical protein BN1183_BA_01870 [Pantoea ananatis]
MISRDENEIFLAAGRPEPGAFLTMLSDAPRPVNMPCHLNRERLIAYQKWYLNRTRAP